MKRLISAVMLIAILLSIAACGGKAQPENSIKPEIEPLPSSAPAQTAPPEPSASPEPVPAITISIETMSGVKTIDGFDVARYSYDYPVITVNSENSSDFDDLKLWARGIAENSEVTAQSLIEEAEYAYANYPQMFTSSYFYTATLEVFSPADGITVLMCDASTFLGGAHPGNSHTAWVIDTNQGKVLTLADLGDAEAIIEAASADIISQIKAKDMDDNMFPDYADSISDGIMDRFWFITEDGLWIIYPEYSIAPYSEGSFLFNVSYDVLEGLINEEYVIR